MDKLSLKPIIDDHLKTFKKSDGNYIIKDIVIFLGMPLMFIFTIGLFFSIDIPKEYIDSLLVAFSILTPLLFGLMPMIFNIIENKRVSKKGYKLLREYKANILFTIILSIFLILILLIWYLTLNLKPILNIIIYFLFIEIILHLFLILQRFNTLIEEFIKLQNKNENT